MTIGISSQFCGGNIVCHAADDPQNIRLTIARDNKSDFYQWFYFRLTGANGVACKLVIENASGAAYPKGWENYQAVFSVNLEAWTRIPGTSYDGKALTIELTPQHDSIYLAYFAPYTLERHARLIAKVQASPLTKLSVLGQTLDGRDMDLVTVGTVGAGKKALWFTARQHPGEAMAEWWMEGFFQRLLDPSDAVAQALLEQVVFYVIPNMNPDGSARGHLRTNAAGINLNREWSRPSMAKSPEVYLTLQKMRDTGVDFALDVHGDEALPYNFIAGCEGVPNFSEAQKAVIDGFKAAYVAANSDFQTEHGYPVNAPGKANLSICGNAIANQFGCASMTLEMPFKDNANAPDATQGWSPARSKALGASTLDALVDVLPKI